MNDLAVKDGLIYANVYFKDAIFVIDYEKGKVVKKYDFSKFVELFKSEKKHFCYSNFTTDEVLNGIEYD